MRLSHVMKAVILLLLLAPVSAWAQQTGGPDFKHVTITITTDGSHCFCVWTPESAVACCPEYSVSLDENGTVIFKGHGALKSKGERVHSISSLAVRELVAEFSRIGFFSLDDRYECEKLANGNLACIDHAYARTISIDLDGKKKSIYLFYGVPQELIDLQRKIIDVTKIKKYVGRAEQPNRWARAAGAHFAS
jgi:hypothetical protein